MGYYQMELINWLVRGAIALTLCVAITGCSGDPYSELVDESRSLTEIEARETTAHYLVCGAVATQIARVNDDARTVFLEKVFINVRLAQTLMHARTCDAEAAEVANMACISAASILSQEDSGSDLKQIVQSRCGDVLDSDDIRLCVDDDKVRNAFVMATAYGRGEMDRLDRDVAVAGDAFAVLSNYYAQHCAQ